MRRSHNPNLSYIRPRRHGRQFDVQTGAYSEDLKSIHHQYRSPVILAGNRVDLELGNSYD